MLDPEIYITLIDVRFINCLLRFDADEKTKEKKIKKLKQPKKTREELQEEDEGEEWEQVKSTHSAVCEIYI